jgi:hypothetical protein
LFGVLVVCPLATGAPTATMDMNIAAVMSLFIVLLRLYGTGHGMDSHDHFPQ